MFTIESKIRRIKKFHSGAPMGFVTTLIKRRVGSFPESYSKDFEYIAKDEGPRSFDPNCWELVNISHPVSETINQYQIY